MKAGDCDRDFFTNASVGYQIVFAKTPAVGRGSDFAGCNSSDWKKDTRVREGSRLLPQDQLSPARSHRMKLDPQWVETVSTEGGQIWRAETGYVPQNVR